MTKKMEWKMLTKYSHDEKYENESIDWYIDELLLSSSVISVLTA